MTFDEWWKQMKPAECDELKEWFIECWNAAVKQEREACAKVCDSIEYDHYRDNKCAERIDNEWIEEAL